MKRQKGFPYLFRPQISTSGEPSFFLLFKVKYFLNSFEIYLQTVYFDIFQGPCESDGHPDGEKLVNKRGVQLFLNFFYYFFVVLKYGP